MALHQSGQLDQISEAIGELKGSFKSLEKYTHEREHGVRNLSQKIDALGLKITRDIAAVEARIEVQISAVSDRVSALEAIAQKQAGERGLFVGFLHSPVMGWLAAAAAFVWAALTERGQ